MRIDDHLVDALAAHASAPPSRLASLVLTRPSPRATVARARRAAALLFELGKDCALWPTDPDLESTLEVALEDDRVIRVYPWSDGIDGFTLSALRRPPLGTDPDRVDRRAIRRQLDALAQVLVADRFADGDELGFERVWEHWIGGVAIHTGETLPTALHRVTGAYRRRWRGVPVWGRASVHVTIGHRGEVLGWGADWRTVVDVQDEQPTVGPREGAARVLAALAERCGGGASTLRNWTPKWMRFGYLAASRRQPQTTMPPVWVAQFDPAGSSSRGHIVAVSGFEQGDPRPVWMPPDSLPLTRRWRR